MEKPFGKFTLAQLREFIQYAPELRVQMDELDRLVRAGTSERLNALVSAGVWWADAYELGFVEHLALASAALGLGPELEQIAKSPDPQQALLERMDDKPPDEHHAAVTEAQLFGLAMSLGKTVTSLMAHGRSLSSFVQAVRETGDVKALIEVVRIDRSAVACPSIAARIAQAELMADEAFFVRLRNALKGPSKKVMRGHFDQLRWVFAALREVHVDHLSDAELEQLLVHDLGIYPNVPTARKNLRAQYNRSRKLKTI